MKSGWSRKFDEPIPLPNGRKLVTLKDAGTYITVLPKTEHMAPEWQDAMQALILVAHGGPTMFARIGMMRALHRHDSAGSAAARCTAQENNLGETQAGTRPLTVADLNPAVRRLFFLLNACARDRLS
jgi:hypothetical protein